MICRYAWIGFLFAVSAAGCASQPQQVSDLSAPSAPRLEWARSVAGNSPTKPSVAQDLVIKEHRFVSRSAELTSDGEDQIESVIRTLKATPARIVIESSGSVPILPANRIDPGDSGKLDLERRQYVIQKLLSLGVSDAEKRVVLEPAA